MEETNKRYTGITLIDQWLNGGESPLRATVSVDTSSLLLPIALLVAGVLLAILILKKKK